MKFSNSGVNGNLMKRIEKVKFYHKSNWHEKLFDLNFDLSHMKITTKEKKKSKIIEFSDFRSCCEINSAEKMFSKRSRSVLDRFTKPEKDCPWMYGFRLETSKRSYELYSPTRSDM